MKIKLSTRGRAITASVFLGVFVFLFISPLYKIVFESIFSPAQVSDIAVLQKNKELDILWKKNTEYDLKGYQITVDGTAIDDAKLLDNSVDKYSIYNLENNRNYNVSIRAMDNNNKLSESVVFTASPADQISTLNINQIDESSDNIKSIITVSGVAAVLLFILNNWVLFFKVKRKALLTIAAFPSVIIIPYLVLFLSILFTLNSYVTKFGFSFVISIGLIFITYLLILTTNILNGSLQFTLPLEQAGKASQFIFSLLSTYLMLIFIFSSNYNLVIRLVVLMAFVFYFTYSCIFLIKGLSEYQAIIRTIVVDVIMGVAILVLSVWPADSVYIILSIAVIYYILLNITLEIRNKLGKEIWVEYSVLLLLITFILFTNAVWGIKGTII